MTDQDAQPTIHDIELPETGEATFWRDGVQHTLRADGTEDDEPTWTLHAEESLIAHISRREGKWIGSNDSPSRQVESDSDWRQVVIDVTD
ncbi:MAG: hypothetical protein JWQ19_2723 [Subtercola sp.]|uniref:hypothetical protein n=1 Tax=Subtercola endophyticus TaxID=2895559 RepID=UPI001E3AB79F|nr:hypothetical protein [Subtercola endophyticus]MCU1481937.1 hypothetical protein [Subtercola sp.]UFS57495.1 hypothetical protein LQ955_10515 [Subtercola endophyticus]